MLALEGVFSPSGISVLIISAAYSSWLLLRVESGSCTLGDISYSGIVVFIMSASNLTHINRLELLKVKEDD